MTDVTFFLTEGDGMATVARMYLRDLLIAKGIHTAAEFGRRIDISRQHAWTLWTGKTLPSLETIQLLIREFGIDPADLAQLRRHTPDTSDARRKPRGKGRRPRR
jgi:transcriptional regulator with XRE-family HTH domain